MKGFHLISNSVYGTKGRGHNKYFASVMENCFGVMYSRTHNISTENVMYKRTKKYQYTCKCSSTHVIGKTRHERYYDKFTNTALLCCKKCKSKIIFVKEISNW